MRRVGMEPEITLTGGVSRNIGIVKALEEKLGQKLNVSAESQFMGAIGAALYALDRCHAVGAAGGGHEALDPRT